jgi:hypothetical protein
MRHPRYDDDATGRHRRFAGLESAIDRADDEKVTRREQAAVMQPFRPMRSINLSAELSYQVEVNRIMKDRGRTDFPLLNVEEMRAMQAAFERGECPSTFAASLPDTRPAGATDWFKQMQEVRRAEAAEREARLRAHEAETMEIPLTDGAA